MTGGDLPDRPRRMFRTFPVSICRASAAAHAAALGVMGLLTKPSLAVLKTFDPTEHLSVPSSAVLILDPGSSLRSFIGWQAYCGAFIVPLRSKRGCLNFRLKLCPRVGRTRPADLVSRERPPRWPMAITKVLARTDETIRRPATARRSGHCRSPAPSPNVSCAFPILTQPCLTAWAATKRDYGARQRKQFGLLRPCDSRRLQCGNDCATGSLPSPGIGRDRSRLTQSLGVECREDVGCARGGSLRKSGTARE